MANKNTELNMESIRQLISIDPKDEKSWRLASLSLNLEEILDDLTRFISIRTDVDRQVEYVNTLIKTIKDEKEYIDGMENKTIIPQQLAIETEKLMKLFVKINQSAYEAYNEGGENKSAEWLDGAYAVVEAVARATEGR